MKIITLACGPECKVDDEDFEMLSGYKWAKQSTGYAMTWRAGVFILMHRMVLNAKKGSVVDHLNHCTLDNRKCNLREGTQSDNMLNRAKLKNSGAAGRFRGVHPYRKYGDNVWIVMYRSKYLGIFRGDDAEERGARAYDAAAIAHRGALAQTNFPQENAA